MSSPIVITSSADVINDGAFSLRLRDLARDSAIGYTANFALLGFGFLTKVLLTRALTPADFGLLTIAQTFLNLGLTPAQYGVLDGVVRFVGVSAGRDRSEAKAVVVGGLRLGLMLVIPLAVVLAASSSWIAEHVYGHPILTGALLLSAVTMPVTVIAEVLAAAYRGIGQIWVKAVLLDVGRALWILGGVALLFVLHTSSLVSVMAVYTAGAIAAVACTATMFVRSHHWRGATSRAPVGDLLRYGLPLMGSSLVVWPMTAIPLLLGSAVSAEAVGYYSLATLLANFVYMPTGAIDTAALPTWSQRIAQNDVQPLREGYTFATRWCLIAALAIFGPLVLCPAEILSLAYGPSYRVAAAVVQTVAVFFLLNAATGPNQSVLRAFGYTRQIFLAHLVGGSVALVVAVVLIPSWGMTGALTALGLSTVLCLTVEVLSLFVLRRMHPFDSRYFRVIAASILALVVTSMLQTRFGEAQWRIASSTAVYFVLFAALMFASGVPILSDARRIWGVPEFRASAASD